MTTQKHLKSNFSLLQLCLNVVYPNYYTVVALRRLVNASICSFLTFNVTLPRRLGGYDCFIVVTVVLVCLIALIKLHFYYVAFIFSQISHNLHKNILFLMSFSVLKKKKKKKKPV